MKKIMILGASILQLPAIQKAKEMGLEVVVVDMNPDAIGFKEKGIVKEVISTIDIPKVLECAKKHKINGIMTLASDMPMRTIAKISEEMNIIGIDERTALKATSKFAMREALKDASVPIPYFTRVKTELECYKASLEVKKKGYKCIIKPVDNSGSRGITLLSNFEEETIKKAYEYGKTFSRSGELMVEEYMEGPEVSVESISIDNKCNVIQITDKLTTGAPYFVEMGHSQPSMLCDNIKNEIIEITKKAVKAIGIKNGPSHTEIKITKEGPKIVELGARLGGDCITTHLVPLSTGVDMVKACIELSLGIKPDLSKKFEKGAAIRYFGTNIGKIRNIHGLFEAHNIEGIKQISFVYDIGEEIKEIKNSSDRIGFVIAQDFSVEKAIERCELVKNIIKVEVV